MKKNTKKQVTLDGMLDKVKRPTEFGREEILHAVTQLVACDDQVSLSGVECMPDTERLCVVASVGGQSCFPELHNQYVERLKQPCFRKPPVKSPPLPTDGLRTTQKGLFLG